LKLVKQLSGLSHLTVTDTTPGASSSSITKDSTIRGGGDIAGVTTTLDTPGVQMTIREVATALASTIRNGDDVAAVSATLETPDVQTIPGSPIAQASTIPGGDDIVVASANLETLALKKSVAGVSTAQASGQLNAPTTTDLPPSTNRAVDQLVYLNEGEDKMPTSLCTVDSLLDNEDNATTSGTLEVADLQTLN
jgi:hypothetical protein